MIKIGYDFRLFVCIIYLGFQFSTKPRINLEITLLVWLSGEIEVMLLYFSCQPAGYYYYRNETTIPNE